MPLKYLHLSDIHFGQESGSDVWVHQDVKERLLDDAKMLARSSAQGPIDGIIVTGDIAFSGKQQEYDEAGNWLDLLAEAVGCMKTDVLVVPGNHDVDHACISPCCRFLLSKVIEGGDRKLDDFLEHEADRTVLYERLSAYRTFAAGYNCQLDTNGGFATDQRVNIAPGRFLRFIGLNSALASSDKDVPGKLLLGARQRLLPRVSGEEVIALCHHPLDWLQDHEETLKYVRSRARVLIFGHVHNPALAIEDTKGYGTLLTLQAGATIPPSSEDGYEYTYNVIDFAWDAESDGLEVTIFPRTWNREETRFDSDITRFSGGEHSVVLDCPNFRSVETADETLPTRQENSSGDLNPSDSDALGERSMAKSCELVRLHFYRDLTAKQRSSVLAHVGALPSDWRGELTHGIEGQLFEAVLRADREDELKRAIETARHEWGTADEGNE